MSLPVFYVGAEGDLVRMNLSAPPSEATMQELIARYPELISNHLSRLLLIRREYGVPDDHSTGGRWSIDHLFVTADAVPVLTEVKRAVDTRLRREVIGQIMDYAANGIAYWPAGALRDEFERNCIARDEDPQTSLSDFIGDRDPDEFWRQVDANLAAGEVRLVIAADEIPRELARIVEFLNEQMRAEVWAVELRYYEAHDGRRTLVPRIIGDTAKGRIQRERDIRSPQSKISVDDWIEEHINPLDDATKAGVASMLEFLRERGAQVTVNNSGYAISGAFERGTGRLAYLFRIRQSGSILIDFGWAKSYPQLRDDQLRLRIQQRFDNALQGSLKTTERSHSGAPGFSAAVLADASVLNAFLAVADEYIAVATE